MLGAIIGDIVGSSYEFNNVKTKAFELLPNHSDFTDDTVLTVAVAGACLAYRQKRSLHLFQSHLVSEMRRMGRAYPGLYGNMFSQWLAAKHPRPYGSYGNGSAMRVSPVAYVAESLKECERLAKASAKVTHNHREGIRGAQSVAAAVYLALAGESKERIGDYIKKKYYALDFTLDDIREDYGFDESCQGSVPQAIQAFMESTDYEDAVRNAVSIGGDSDTIACIAGAIAEAYYKDIPEALTAPIEQYFFNAATFPDFHIYAMFRDQTKHRLERK